MRVENGPASLDVSGLPRGLTLDRETSVISGQPDEAGDFLVLVMVANRAAAERRFLSIRIRESAAAVA